MLLALSIYDPEINIDIDKECLVSLHKIIQLSACYFSNILFINGNIEISV